MKKLTLVLFAACGLVFSQAALQAEDAPSYRDNLNAGFFLLHDLLDNEASLPILLDLKSSPQEIQNFADKISRTAKEGEAAMDKMREADPKISWDKNPLPKIEQDIRASITDEKEHQLLFGTKGPEFVRALLVSQAEASKYAANIAKVLARQDKNPWHRREFSGISARWHALYEEDFRLLRNY
ncbi:MAG TPA: hypothetical protein VHY09_13565 [Candidatus Methylacidiphilales bacterium]|jgi:hypothetical protein|nr:hypothetical protein [Candidatus Methylacidiphilales bacterium]